MPGIILSTLDIFAIVVLAVLAISIVVVIVVLGSLPGKIARGRDHPHAQAVTVAGWIGLIFVAFWPLALIWAYVDVPRAAPAATDWNDLRRRLSRRRGGTSHQGGGGMIVFLLVVYLVFLFLLVKLKIVRFNFFWKASPFIWLGILLIGLFIPMGWGAPQGPVMVVRQSVQIVPNVAGEVVDVPVEPNKPLKVSDVLFRIDPVPYQAKVDQVDAQLKFAQQRYEQFTQLQTRGSGRAFDVEQREAEVDQYRAALEDAKSNLDKTIVRAPADGYVTNVALRKGARVSSLPLSPVMAFIDTSETIVGVEIPQIYARYIEPDQEVEVTFKYRPGEVFTGHVESVLQATAAGWISRYPARRSHQRRSRPRRSSCACGLTISRSRMNCRRGVPAKLRSILTTSSRRT